MTADDGSWSSAKLVPREKYAHTFDSAGVVPYYCQVHGFMHGDVDVHRLLLTRPREPGAAGRPYVLSGRAALPADSPVSIESDSGGGFQPAGRAAVDEHGEFRATVTPRTSAMFRAVAGGEASPPVQLLVLDRKVVASAARRGTRVVRAQVLPASPAATVVLQLRLRERFGWWPVAQLRLDRASHARFVVRLDRRVRARVALTLRDGATQLALSRTLHIGPRHRG